MNGPLLFKIFIWYFYIILYIIIILYIYIVIKDKYISNIIYQEFVVCPCVLVYNKLRPTNYQKIGQENKYKILIF